MKILVAGKDRTAELGPGLTADSERRGQDPRCLFLDWSVNALSLSDARDESDYLDRLTRLVRYTNHVDPRVFDIPRRPGLVGSALAGFKKVLWKVLRYQHDRVTFRQNLINSNLIALVEFQREEIKRLDARLAAVEREPGS